MQRQAEAGGMRSGTVHPDQLHPMVSIGLRTPPPTLSTWVQTMVVTPGASPWTQGTPNRRADVQSSQPARGPLRGLTLGHSDACRSGATFKCNNFGVAIGQSQLLMHSVDQHCGAALAKWAAAGSVDTDLRSSSVLELYRTDIAERRMPAPGVVEALDVVEHISPGFIARPVDLAGYPLGLH